MNLRRICEKERIKRMLALRHQLHLLHLRKRSLNLDLEEHENKGVKRILRVLLARADFKISRSQINDNVTVVNLVFHPAESALSSLKSYSRASKMQPPLSFVDHVENKGYPIIFTYITFKKVVDLHSPSTRESQSLFD